MIRKCCHKRENKIKKSPLKYTSILDTILRSYRYLSDRIGLGCEIRPHESTTYKNTRFREKKKLRALVLTYHKYGEMKTVRKIYTIVAKMWVVTRYVKSLV